MPLKTKKLETALNLVVGWAKIAFGLFFINSIERSIII
jgi:hypothetical protein